MEKDSAGDTGHLIAIAQLKARLSEVLRMVQAGREIVVTDHGRPVARLVPLRATDEALEHAKNLVARGLAREGVQPISPEFWSLPRPEDPCGRAVEALLEERAEDR